MKYDAADWDKTWLKPYGRRNAHHEAVFRLMSPYLTGRIVDLGCGPCLIWQGKKVSGDLADRNVDLTGVDFSREALQAARRVVPTATLIQADATSTGLPSGIFDTVVMLGLLDYFEDWTPVLREARRLKKQGGKIFATLLNGHAGHDWTSYPHITGNWHLYAELE